jgi:ribonucleotide monophosphatase NagD (HAD superfamily)
MASSTPPAIAFDIDGVFKAGRFFFEDGLRALAACKAAGCAVCFVTNGGGGLSESSYLEVNYLNFRIYSTPLQLP